MRVYLTQFLLPDGRKRTIFCDDVDDSLAPKVQAIKDAGCRLTAEVLMIGMVSQTIEHSDGDFLIEISAHTPEATKAALEKLLRDFDSAAFATWLSEITS